MDRKGIFGIVLLVLGFVGWEFYYTQVSQQALKAQREAAAAQEIVSPVSASADQKAAESKSEPVRPAAGAVAAPRDSGKIEKISTDFVEYAFTTLGGGISSARLLKHGAEGDSKVVLNEFGRLPLGAVTEIAGESVEDPFAATVSAAGDEIVFDRTDARQLQTTKKFSVLNEGGSDKATLQKTDYLLRLDLSFTNRGAQSIQVPAYFVYTGSSSPVHQRDLPTYTGFAYYHEGHKFIDVNWFSRGLPLVGHAERPIFNESASGIRWAGVSNQYFATMLTPLVDERASSDVLAKHRGAQAWARRFVIQDEEWIKAGRSLDGKSGESRFGVDGALGMPGFSLKPGESFVQAFHVYTGPREYQRLKLLGNSEDEIMNFGMFGLVSKALLSSMNMLKGWLGNYAWAIVVLTLAIKTALWPLQNKATRSMKQMQALQPRMTEVRDKYKDDPTRMNAEVMKLYKDYGVNPVAGCLPMLMQIPIFFGFYNMLGVAVELRNSKFLWVKDLSQPDTVAHLLGYPVNVLPLCMAVTMFVQMAIQPKSGDPIQQRVFMFMPLIFVFFCYNFASALALYWTVQNLFSIAQLYLTRDQAAPQLVKLSAPSSKKGRH